MGDPDDEQPRQSYNATDEKRLLGKLIFAGFGLDRSWIAAGVCTGYARTGALADGTQPPGAPDWHNDIFDNPKNCTEEMRLASAKGELALLYCGGCPAQYECARYGMESEAQAALFGVRTSHMRWLQQNKERGRQAIADAEAEGAPIEQWLRFHRGDYAPA